MIYTGNLINIILICYINHNNTIFFYLKLEHKLNHLVPPIAFFALLFNNILLNSTLPSNLFILFILLKKENNRKRVKRKFNFYS